MELTKNSGSPRRARTVASSKQNTKRRLVKGAVWFGLVSSLLLAATAWLAQTASTLTGELEAATQLLPQLRSDIARNDPTAAAKTVDRLTQHTSAAKAAGEDPMWTAARVIPWLGANFQAASEVATSADDLARLGATPVTQVFQSLDWKALVPSSTGMDLESLRSAGPKIASAAYAVGTSSDRLNTIDVDSLLPQVARPIVKAREQLGPVRDNLETAATVAGIAPAMLGAEGQRNYLLMIQNNAETRASGGIPGALAVLTLDKGKLTLGAQSSAGDVGFQSPALPVDVEQQQIYSTRVGMYMQDVNLTPDFPTAASTAQAMWDKKTGQRVDGVISLDPVALGYVLDATGPVKITSPELLALTKTGLPAELNGKNVVATLLSDVYGKIARPQLQDVYFAGVAKEIFAALSSGKGEATGLIDGLARGTAEGRVLLWSDARAEQDILKKYPLSGSIAGPSIAPAQFGVYFNDGTGAKMDYYVKRTVQLVEECTGDGYRQVGVRITSTNTAPTDAATSLPEYVTGGGAFGVPAGSVQTNVIAYGPVQANVEEASVDGKKANFSAQHHANRPVGTLTVTLAPGQSSEVEFTFGKIVQHAEPTVVVTPTVQPRNEVILPPENTGCGASK